jgi:hypothetical protein
MRGVKRGAARAAIGLGLLAIGVSTCPRDALASEVFPPAIREHLQLAADPPCTFCHATDEGEDDTVVKPFGITMMRLGVSGDSDTRKLIAAIAVSEANQLDSDTDGTPDITELRLGSDPNDGVDVQIPQTGCSLSPRAANRWSELAIAVIAGLGIAFRWKRRPSSPGVAQLANSSPREC